jgi:hypothetical protein
LIVGLGGIFAAEFWLEQECNDNCRWRRWYHQYKQTITRVTFNRGQAKIKIVADRLMDINPALKLTQVEEFLSPERLRNR